ncbi:MAG TPA: sugar transferase [Nitrospirota bacterium]|nr:sugar transferase [Nitrospirota bacterium]
MKHDSFFTLSNVLYDSVFGCYREECFHELLVFERRRHERSRRSFLVMTLDFTRITDLKIRHEVVRAVMNTLSTNTRSTDIKGWYWGDKVLGVIMTEMQIIEKETLQGKILQCLQTGMRQEWLDMIGISFHQYPEDGRLSHMLDGPACLTFYSDMARQRQTIKIGHKVKRIIDIIGSIAAIVIFSPFFILVPIGIKLTSRGPVLYRQERMGQCAEKFSFLKFRSMYVNSDQDVHREFVQNFIAKQPTGKDNGGNPGKMVYKIVKDKRVTPFGHILRRTSLDELPQFINVLKGEMSLVGPRPPIPYEIEKYDSWHWRRVMEVKPGITGLWQVMGRSSTTFDDMVRLDLKYVTNWSLWLDIMILFKTPGAVLSGKGAY